MTRVCQWGLAGLLVAALPLIGCAPKTETSSTAPKELPTIPITVSPIEARSIQRTVNVVGTLHGYEDLTIAPKVDGRVTVIRVDVGDVALPGCALLELDDVDYKLDVEANRRAFDAELARLGLKELPVGEFDPELVPPVRRADVALTNAKIEFNRIKSLSKSVASQRELDNAEMEFRVAEASKNDAVTQAKAVLASARHRKAVLDLSIQRLADSKLTAPIPHGWSAWSAIVGPAANPMKYSVAAKLVSEGEMVRSMPVTNAFRLIIDHALKLKAAVPERFAPDVRVGLKVQLSVDAYPDKTFMGQVTRVNPTVDVATRTFQVEIAVVNFDGKLKAGSFARAAIQTRTDSEVKTVPTRSVISFAGVNKIFVLQDGKAKVLPVEPGYRGPDWIEVQTEAAVGSPVITSGLSQLVDGSPVQVKK